ncbi:MAG TPA: tripartite tricarboxylate transporter substrate-binding protein, partial [Acidovorax defluvii]|nr:tripartite tricarboxylate transporter substrate-binding protein [Acidovorax defluvii]
MTPSPLRRAALALALAATFSPALAQSTTAAATPGWPSKPVKLVVGFPGGSSPDLVARTLAEPLAKALGQPVIVENKVGAGGNIAADAVAKATDDHTLGIMINGNLTIARLINPRINYDPLKDLTPISLIATAPLALAAPANAPGATAQEFFAAARASGDRWNYGTPGVGTVAHIGMELLKNKAGINPVHVPYPGNPQVINAIIGGQIQL